MSRREQIRFTAEEQAAFLDEQRTVICATQGMRGWPHLMPLWYVVRDGDLWAWTYGRSQKIRNLRRNPRATLQVEAGETYDQLRGVMIEARAQLHHELDVVSGVGAQLLARYGNSAITPEIEAAVAAQAPKRVAMRFVAERTASWDHRKLAGTY